MNHSLTSITVLPSLEGSWEKLSQVVVKGAEYNSRERQPHPKCLQGTRVDLLKYIHGLLDDPEKNRLIWLHGTAGVGKSAVAFTVAERMRGLKVTETTNVEKRLAGTFFFSRKHTKRCTAGYFFATLVSQLANNFPNIRKDVNRAIRDNPALLDPDTPLCDQMEVLFLQPLRKLRLRLRGCPPLSFVVDALDECTSEPELTDLILSLARALREPDLPVTHILLTSRSESHICRVMQKQEVRPLVCEIPVKTSGEGVSVNISLDGADVGNDIYIFLQHSFRELENRHPDFPQPSRGQLERLASRAGRRFIVASTMMKFIDDGDNDPHDRLQLMLELLPGTEVYKLYDCILSTCADPKRAYLHLSIVAALADPLPISQISKLLGSGLGRDVETTLVQLRSVMDIPADSSLPVNLYHSSVRDYVSDPSNSSFHQERNVPSPHSLLADCSFRLMMKEISHSTALLDALSELKRQSQAMQPHDPQILKDTLVFVARPEPLPVLIGLLWLRGDRSSDLQAWLDTQDGYCWLETQGGGDWLRTQGGVDWLQTRIGQDWLQSPGGADWWNIRGGQVWSQTLHVRARLRTWSGRDSLQTQRVRDWLQAQHTQASLQTPYMHASLEKPTSVLPWRQPIYWMLTQGVHDWLQTLGGRRWLRTQSGRDWLRTPHGKAWQSTPAASAWVIMEEFSNTLQAISKCIIVPDLPLLPAFQAIQQFKSLPDFLMFPAFLALMSQDHPTSALPQGRFTDMEVIRAMKTFESFASEARERCRSASDALKYACQHWAIHLSRAPTQWDDTLDHIFQAFWNHHLLSWLEQQWCLKGLRSCLVSLSQGQKFAKAGPINVQRYRVPPATDPDFEMSAIEALTPAPSILCHEVARFPRI